MRRTWCPDAQRDVSERYGWTPDEEQQSCSKVPGGAAGRILPALPSAPKTMPPKERPYGRPAHGATRPRGRRDHQVRVTTTGNPLRMNPSPHATCLAQHTCEEAVPVGRM